MANLLQLASPAGAVALNDVLLIWFSRQTLTSRRTAMRCMGMGALHRHLEALNSPLVTRRLSDLIRDDIRQDSHRSAIARSFGPLLRSEATRILGRQMKLNASLAWQPEA